MECRGRKMSQFSEKFGTKEVWNPNEMRSERVKRIKMVFGFKLVLDNFFNIEWENENKN